MGYEYTDESRARDPHALPDVEVFHVSDAVSKTVKPFGIERDAGWYFAFGFPGCLWDGEPSGPYASEAEALAAARDAAGDSCT